MRAAPAPDRRAAGADGRFYCCQEHRQRAAAEARPCPPRRRRPPLEPFDLDLGAALLPAPPAASASTALWQAFMVARIAIAGAAAPLLGAMMRWAWRRWTAGSSACVVYLAAAVAVRLLTRPGPPGRSFDAAVGLHHRHRPADLRHAALPAERGTELLAPVRAAGAHGLGARAPPCSPSAPPPAWPCCCWWTPGCRACTRPSTPRAWRRPAWPAAATSDRAAGQPAGGAPGARGAGARRSLSAARTQALVNELVIDTLNEGLLVVGADWRIHAANPSARALLGWQAREAPASLALVSRPGVEAAGRAGAAHLRHRRRAERGARAGARARRAAAPARAHPLTPPQDPHSEPLCVMFLQDLREAEAQLRTEKLAAMGRMSAAVAHEIRNPLAAITQANGLLAEELDQPAQQQLAALVRKNAQRLSQIVEEILNLARRPPAPTGWTWTRWCRALPSANGNASHRRPERVQLHLASQPAWAAFDGEHLRRVLVNLLDNALRYAQPAPGAIVVATDVARRASAPARVEQRRPAGPRRAAPPVRALLLDRKPLHRIGPVHLPRVVRPPRRHHRLCRRAAPTAAAANEIVQRDVPHGAVRLRLAAHPLTQYGPDAASRVSLRPHPRRRRRARPAHAVRAHAAARGLRRGDRTLVEALQMLQDAATTR